MPTHVVLALGVSVKLYLTQLEPQSGPVEISGKSTRASDTFVVKSASSINACGVAPDQMNTSTSYVFPPTR